MEKSEINNLIQKLADLSEFEEQNMDRMKEIAHILVQEYMHPTLDNIKKDTCTQLTTDVLTH